MALWKSISKSGNPCGFGSVLHVVALSICLSAVSAPTTALAKVTRPKQHSAAKKTQGPLKETYSATTEDTPAEEIENLTMDDIGENQTADTGPELVSDLRTDHASTPDEELDNLEADAPKEKLAIKKANTDKAPPTSREQDALSERLAALEQELAAFREATRSETAKRESKPQQPQGADIVPEKHRDAIIKRLRIVEKLIRKHGLAYDYRTMTTRKLEETLTQLDNETRQ